MNTSLSDAIHDFLILRPHPGSAAIAGHYYSFLAAGIPRTIMTLDSQGFGSQSSHYSVNNVVSLHSTAR